MYAPSGARKTEALKVETSGHLNQSTDGGMSSGHSDGAPTKKVAGKKAIYNWSPETAKQAQEDLDQLKRILKVQKLYASGIPLTVERANGTKESEA